MPAFKWEEQKTPRYRYLIYGVPGVGKTTLSASLPGKTYMLSLDGSFTRIKAYQGNQDIWLIDPETPIEDLNRFVVWFNHNAKTYDNLVIDNLSNLQKLWFVEKAKESKTGLDNQLAHYNEYSNWAIRLFSKLLSYDVNIMFTAWEARRPITDANGQQFEQYGPDVRDQVRDYVMGNCDVVGRLISKEDGTRGVILTGDVGTYAKNRLDDRRGCVANELFTLRLPAETGRPSQAEPSDGQ